jgi:hypothetical protein
MASSDSDAAINDKSPTKRDVEEDDAVEDVSNYITF